MYTIYTNIFVFIINKFELFLMNDKQRNDTRKNNVTQKSLLKKVKFNTNVCSQNISPKRTNFY